MADLPDLIARLERARWKACVCSKREHVFALDDVVGEVLVVLKKLAEGEGNGTSHS